MTMSFNILKLQSEFTVCISRYKNQYNKTRPSPNLAIKILFQTNERNNSPKSKNRSYSSSTSIPNHTKKTSPLLTQTNTIGIIGGVSALSTLNFAEKLVKWSSKDGEEKSLPFVICSDPLLKKELSCCGSSFHLGTKNECLNLDFRPITENLRSKKAYLEQSGARCIVMPCHISHIWHGEISQGCSVPFLHVGDCVVKELKEAKLKPLEAGSNLRIGVLSTDATLTAGFYQEKLQDQGFEVVLPDKATMEHTVIPAIEALNRKDMEGARNLLRIALQVLIVRAVNTVILASDDMRDLLPSDDPLLKKCIDPIDSLVRSTIRWAQSTEFASKNI